LQEAFNNQPELAAKVFEALQSVTPGQIISEGRVYGGGLYKVEPKELAQIPATKHRRTLSHRAAAKAVSVARIQPGPK